MKKRFQAVGDRFVCRFPPEPNGYLHIGHAKSMYFNFGLAKTNNGDCILRYDDTNPDAESKEFIDNIQEDMRWLGHEPAKITFSSDYFPEMYQLAVNLIKKGSAYVCHHTQEEVKARRKTRTASDWRDRPIEESLKLFEMMKMGMFAEGEASLRMKGDLDSPNANMNCDHVAYRIKYSHHPHVGDQWCIYPSYDFTHCIIDSLEWVTASCCTLEFENRRESYFWLLDELDLYKPNVWEFSRFVIENNFISKRYIKELVAEGAVSGWDDPRLVTLKGLRRRGIPPQAINDLCEETGVTRNTNSHSPEKLYTCARNVLDSTAGRGMCVLKPLRVNIVNFEGGAKSVKCPHFPQDKNRGFYNVPFGKTVYIDRDDFSLEKKDDKKYYGLVPDEKKTVRLKYAFNITYVSHKTDGDGNVVEISVKYDPESSNSKAVKRGHLTWVCNGVPAEFRLYNTLFNVPIPTSNWRQELNSDSLVVERGFVTKPIIESKENSFQFERLGYFCKDSVDYTPEKPVFNRICELRARHK